VTSRLRKKKEKHNNKRNSVHSLTRQPHLSNQKYESGFPKETQKQKEFCSFSLTREVRGRRQAHNPTLAKIMRLAYDRSHSHNRPQTAACNAVYSISRRASVITRLGEQLPRPRQVSMRREKHAGRYDKEEGSRRLWFKEPIRENCRSLKFLPVVTFSSHTFSAFWLRSSVVSVLISLISDTGATGPLQD
jgi:hypothetical protein